MKSQVCSGKQKNKRYTLKAIVLIRKIQGASMTPSYQAGQIVLAVRPWRALRVNDVVVFRHGSIEKLKRIRKIDAHGIYVLGDNTVASTDSRQFGTVAPTSVVGVVIWPKKVSTTA